jgi:hypothetical protein
MPRHGWVWTLLAAAVLAPHPLEGQDIGLEPAVDVFTGPEHGEFGGGGLYAHPMGEFADYVGSGGGLYLFGVLYFGERRRIGLRLDGTLITYGSESVRRPLDPVLPLGDVEVTTNNSIGSFSIGPQLMIGRGTWRIYLYTAVGDAQFATTTSAWGGSGAVPIASTQNFQSHTLLLAAGGGLRMVFRRERRHPLGLDLGTSYAHHGQTEYLREGGIQTPPGGGVEFDVIRSGANLATAYLGMAIGVR